MNRVAVCAHAPLGASMGSPSTRTHQIARALEAHFEVAVLTTPSEAAGFDALDEQRSGFLLESDLGVAAYLDLIETRFAYRARLLDYFWAGLPTVTTRGDTLGEFASERQLGRAVGFRDVAGWTAAIGELITTGKPGGARARTSRRSGRSWPGRRS